MSGSSKWFTQLRWAIKCPGYYLLRLVTRPGTRLERGFHQRRAQTGLAKILGVPQSSVESWLRDAEENALLRQADSQLRQLPYAGTFRGAPELFVLVRGSRPKNLVETGVGLGLSSTYILEALVLNDVGRLISIDLPNSDANWRLPEGLGPGALVPADLRARWELRLGPTRVLLPRALSELGSVDLFFHDSEHSYENMMFEYNLAFESLSPGGLIISDDTMWNSAFLDFAKSKRLKIEFVYHRGGSAPFALVRKPKRGHQSVRET